MQKIISIVARRKGQIEWRGARIHSAPLTGARYSLRTYPTLPAGRVLTFSQSPLVSRTLIGVPGPMFSLVSDEKRGSSRKGTMRRGLYLDRQSGVLGKRGEL